MQRKNEMLEQFHAYLVKFAPLADCGDRENEWVCDIVTAHKFNEKITKELLAETRSPHQGEKDIEHSKAVKTNLFGAPATTTTSFKKEPMGYLQPRGRSGNHPNGYQNNQRGRENLPSPNRFHRSYNPNANYMQEQMLTTCKKSSNQQEDEDSVATEDNNDPVAYDEFMSSSGWKEIPKEKFNA